MAVSYSCNGAARCGGTGVQADGRTCALCGGNGLCQRCTGGVMSVGEPAIGRMMPAARGTGRGMARKLIGHWTIGRRLLAGTALAGLAASSPAFAQTWTGGAGTSSWFDAANWSPSIVPTSGTTIIINNGSTATPVVINAAGAQSGGVKLGNVAGSIGSLLVTGAGRITDTGTYFIVGDRGEGAITVSNGGQVTTKYAVVGNYPNSIGKALVTGAGSQWTATQLMVSWDDKAVGTFEVTDGGKLQIVNPGGNAIVTLGSDSTTADGTLTITGKDSSFLITNGVTFNIGAPGRGVFKVLDGASADTSAIVNINSQSQTLVSGTGSIWSAQGGLNNAGTLTVTDGGALDSNGRLRVLATGTATVTQGGTAKATEVEVFGVGTVDSGGTLSSSGSIWVGGTGGVLTVADGGTLRTTDRILIGSGTGTGGTLIIGAKAGQLAVAPGTVEVPYVVFEGSANPGTRTLVFNHTSNNYVFAPYITGGSGKGNVNVLAGSTTLAGGVAPFDGIIDISSGAILKITANASPNIVLPVETKNDGTLFLNSADLFTRATGNISGTGNVVKTGSGWLTLTGQNSWTGGTEVQDGRLYIGQLVGAEPQDGTLIGDVLNNGMLMFRRKTDYTFGGVISGSGSFEKEGDGKLTLTGQSTYAGSTTVWSGRLALGADNRLPNTTTLRLSGGTFDLNGFSQTVGNLGGFTSGTLAIATGALTTVTSVNTTLPSDITGTGDFIKQGAATLTLTGSKGFAGATTVAGGRLQVDGSMAASRIGVNSGATLGGSGSVGDTSIANGGILEGRTGQMLTVGALALSDASNVNVALGVPSNVALFNVTGALTLDGHLNATAGAGFSNGTYRLFDYGGGLTNNGLVISTVPTGYNPGDFTLNTATAGQVNLIVPTTGAGEQYWDGANMNPGNVANGRGGAGRWNSGNTNWTNQAGAINAPWAGQKAVFAGTAGDIIIDAGGVNSSGLDFRTSGYNLTGGPINLTAGATLNVAGDANSAVYMSAPLIGAGDFTKTGPGLWTGKGTFSGLVTIDGGSIYLYDRYAGGTKTITSRGAVIGGSVGSNATVSAFSAGGGWDAGHADFVIGDAGTGTLKLYGGLNTTPPEIIADRVVLGRAATGHGTLWISGDLFGSGKVSAAEVVGGAGGGDVIFRSANRFAPKLTGKLAVSVENGEVILSGLHDYTGPTAVQRQGGVAAATLTLDGATLSGTAVTVGVGGTLGGQGAVVGAVTLAGGTLKGTSGQTLSLGSVVMDQASKLNVALGAPGNTKGLFKVNGNLVLDGTLNATDAGGFGAGVYRIFDYGGALTDNGLDVGTLPSGSGTIQTAVANQINLVVSGGSGGATEFWNGTHTSADGTIHGGSGTWIAGPTNWTNANGTATAAWGGQFAIFQNSPGTVTVDNSAGAISTTGMQFVGANWRVTGDPVTLNGAGGSTSIRVGDGTAAGASSTATIASRLTGNSQLVKADLGELILTGANSYTGGTTISAGSLQIGDGVGGTTGSIVGDVTNNSLLRFGRSDATTFAGTISGTGMAQVVTGNVTLTADNTYTGGTSVLNGASLSVGNGGTTGSIGGPGYIFVGGSLIFNRSNDLTIGGSMVGTGSLRQIGTGKTELAGNFSSFTGATTVENGTLAVNGQLGGTLDVFAGGRLQGVGTVGNTIVSGVIAPGNSIGTLNVGNITFNAGSIYEVEVNAAGQTDLIKASGTATITGGTVRVLAGMGNYAPATTYKILTAQGGLTVNSAFSGVTSNLAFLDSSLSYDANNIWLTATRNTVAFNNVGITPNQIAAGSGVESLGLGNSIYNAVLNLSAPQARYAFDQLSGEGHASARTVMIEDSRFLRGAVNDRLRAAFGGVDAAAMPVMAYADGGPEYAPATTDRFAVWGQAFGSWGHWNSDGNAARLNRSTGGFFVGADAPVFDTWRFGAVAGYSRTNFNARDRASSGSSDNYHLGLYGGTNWGDLAFRAGAAYTWHDIATSRSVVFPGFGDSIDGKYDTGTAQVFGELAYGMNMGAARFEPFANLAYVNLHTDGFRETGGAAALTSPSTNTDATFTTLGLRASTTFNLGEAAVTAKGMLGWRHAFGDVTPDAMMRFAGGGDAFSIGGVPIARNAVVVEAGLDFNLSPNAVLGVSYGGQFGSGVTDQAFRASFNVKF